MSHGLYCFSVVKGSLYKSKLKPLKSLKQIMDTVSETNKATETNECVFNINGAAHKTFESMIILKPSVLVNFVKPSGDAEPDTFFCIYQQGFAVCVVG